MSSHITLPAQTSGAKANAHFAIDVIPLPDAVRNNQNLPAFVTDYYAKSHEIREFFPAFAERLKAAAGGNRQPLIHEATPGAAKDALMARVLFLTEEMLQLARATEQQSRRQAELQSIDDGLDVKLDRLNVWKKVSVLFFTLAAAAISAVAAVTAVNLNPKRIAAAAVATAATVLIGALGNWIRSLLKKPRSAVKKNRDIIRAMLIGAEIIIRDLSQVYDLACDLQSQTAFIWEMIDDGAADVAVREKVVALNNSFRNLQRKVRSCSSDVSSAREAVLQSIIRNSISLN